MATRTTKVKKTKNKDKGITIANVVSITGIVLLLVFTFMGHSYLSGGELGMDILISALITAFTALLLWFMIKAKGAENNIKKWLVVEYITLGVYTVFAIPSSIFGGIMHFFVVNENKEEIKDLADDDLQKIDDLFSEYDNYESTAIATTVTGLQNATGRRQLCDASVYEFMDQNHIARTRESAENYGTVQKNKLIGAGFDELFEVFQEKKNEIHNAVNSWSILLIPSKAKMIETLAESAEKQLSELSNDARLPVIAKESGRFVLGEYQCREFRVEGGTDSFKFKKALRDTSGFSAISLVIILFLHFMILFNYIFAYRSSKVELGKDYEEDGGIVL